MLQLRERLENVGLDLAGNRQERRVPRCAPSSPRAPARPLRRPQQRLRGHCLSRGSLAHQLSCPRSPVSWAETATGRNGNWNRRPEEGVSCHSMWLLNGCHHCSMTAGQVERVGFGDVFGQGGRGHFTLVLLLENAHLHRDPADPGGSVQWDGPIRRQSQ